jgi:hypothetical protein
MGAIAATLVVILVAALLEVVSAATAGSGDQLRQHHAWL